MTEKLVPPQRKEPSPRAVLLAAGIGAIVGAIFGAMVWFISGEPSWLYAVPIAALLGAGVRRMRPNVLWGQRA
jgi:hypothetical protein